MSTTPSAPSAVSPIDDIETTETTKRRGRVFIVGSLALILGSLLALFIIVSAIFRFGMFSDGKTTITSSGIGGSFNDIAELAVEEYVFTNVGKFEESGIELFGWGLPMTGSSFLITYDGEVKAGIDDFSQIDIEIDDTAEQVTLVIPEPGVLSSSIDPSSVVVYDQSMNPFNQLKVEDLTTFLAVETENAEAKAVDKGLLKRAESHVAGLMETHVTTVLEGTDKEGYEVIVEWKAPVNPRD